MNEQFARRVQKLMKINMKCEVPPEIVSRLVNDSIALDNRISGKSDKEVIDVLILKDEQHDSKSIGLMYHILTSAENQDFYQRIIRFINGGGVEYWHNVLCNMNMILFECWPHIHLQCREQLLRLIREAIRQNVKQIENVLMNAYRVANGCFDNVSKQRIFAKLAGIIRENEGWFKSQKAAAALVGNIITCTASIISYTPVPITATDTFRESMIDFVCWVIRNKKTDCLTLGRDFILVFIRLGKIPQIDEIWKDIQANPASYGIASIEDYWAKNHYLQHVRISIELERKIMWMIHNGNKNLLTYYMWFSNKYLRGIDGPALRMECVRHILYLAMDPAKTQPTAYENRVQLLHLIVSTAPPGPDSQILKLCLFVDWFGCDEKNTSNFNYVELPFNVVRYALCLPLANHPPTSIVQNSHGVQFANSLLDFLCKSVDSVFPSNTEYIRRNVNNAMRYCKERLQHSLSQTLENSKIDRKVSESLRGVFPDFMRGSNGAIVRPKKKLPDGPPTPTKNPQKNPLSSPTASEVTSDKPSTSSAPSSSTAPEPITSTTSIDKPSSSSSASRAVDLERQEKEKAEKVDLELSSLIKGLRGEVGEKMEALRTQWKEWSDDADKCENVEGILQHMFNTEENFDDAQQEVAAQCLLCIMGSVVTPEKSLLPENEKDLSEAFTHPIYSFLKMLCSPPDDDDASREMMINMTTAMREKDSSLTYVLLYFIKGTYGETPNKVQCYKDIAKMSSRTVDDMLASDLQLCAVNDNRLFSYLFNFTLTQFAKEVAESPPLMATICANIDASQLRGFLSEIIRDELKVFRKEHFSKMVMDSVEWATNAQWVFWHLVHADGVPIEWFLSSIPKLNNNHDEAMSNIILLMKRMDREPWAGLIRAIFSRMPNRNDRFPVDALKILLEDTDQAGKVADLVASALKKAIGNNDVIGVGARSTNKGKPIKMTVQQMIEHLQHFCAICVEKKQKTTEAFMGRASLQDAFAAIRANEKGNLLVKKYGTLFGAMEVIAQDAKEHTSSRTLRGNRGGSAADKSQQQKRKASDMDTDDEPSSSTKKRKGNRRPAEYIELSDSDSD